MPDVDKLFLEELARRGVTATRNDDGSYSITQGSGTNIVSLDNLRRDVARDGDLERVSNFVDTVLSVIKTPTWEEAKPFIRWQLESLDGPVDEALHDRVSDQVALVLVLASPDETQIRWLGEATATAWGQTKESLFAVASDNMTALVAQAAIQFEPIDEHKLGMIVTEWPAYKAALLYSRGLKAKVEPVLGWPVFAVTPCRDFVYLVPATDKELLPRMGPVVVKEYKQGAYPLSTEVFELTDAGIRAVFEFQKSPTAPPADAPESGDESGWRTIKYGEFFRFRVPAHWIDEPVQRATEHFDPDGLGRLMVLVLGKELEKPVTADSGREEAESLAAARGGTVTPRDPTTWLVEEGPSDADVATVWGWMLVAAVPPNQVQIVSFKYYVPTATLKAEPEQVDAERAMVRHEVVTAFFQPVPIPDSPPAEKPKPAPGQRAKRDKGDKN